MSPTVIRNCKRKIVYRSLASAHFAVQVLECKFGDTPVRPYRCRCCGAYHLGRSDAYHVAAAWQVILQQHATTDALLSPPVVEEEQYAEVSR
jgi:hypothetical protein